MKILVIACLLVSAPVLAQPRKSEAEAAYKLGQALYLREDYAAAANQFKAAHDLDPDPVYLFNIAQAHRLAKQCKDAGDYYRRYLDAAKRAPNADAVKDYITEVDDCAKAQAPVVVTPPPAPPPVIEPPVAKPEVERDERPRSNKRLAGYIVGGGGVALVGLGALFAKQVGGLEDDAAAVCPSPCTMWDDAKTRARDKIDDRAARREKLMVGSFIAGGAAIATGVYLIVTGRASQDERAVSITPTKNGAVATIRF